MDRQKTLQTKLADKSREITVKQKEAAKAEVDLELARQTLARLAHQVSELESIPVHVETLEHKITPISRTVNGKEKHYRLEGNRVAEVPVEELVARFREQIDRRKDWLAKTRQHQGLIGPIRGFNMQYLVRVESMSDMDALKSGYGGYRVSLSSWEIRPEPDLKGETDTVALRNGAQFYQSILGTSPDTTLTFWVYPDSFSLYRKLQQFMNTGTRSLAAHCRAGFPRRFAQWNKVGRPVISNGTYTDDSRDRFADYGQTPTSNENYAITRSLRLSFSSGRIRLLSAPVGSADSLFYRTNSRN